MDISDPSKLKDLSRSERVTTLPDISGADIDSIPKEERLAPEPDIDVDTIDSIEDLGEAIKPYPRSQRVQVAFDFRPTDYQALLLDYPSKVDRAQVAPQKGRQTGATTIAGVIGADHALTNRNVDVLYSAPGQDTSDEMFAEFKDAFKNGPLTLDQYGITKDNERLWEIDTGTRALSRTLGNVKQDNNSGNRGFSPTCVIVDEAAYTYDKVFDDELEPFFITHPQYEYYLFSTPAGESGYYFERVQEGHREIDAAANEPFGWYTPYWPTKISPFAQQDYIEKQRQKKDDSTFAREYLGQFASGQDNAIPRSTLMPNIAPNPNRKANETRVCAIDPARKGSDEMVAFDLTENGKWWNVWAFEDMTGPVFLEFCYGIQHKSRFNEDIDVPWDGAYPQPVVGSGTTPANGYNKILIEENGVGGFGADFAEASLGNVVNVFQSTNESKQDGYQRLITDLEKAGLELPNHEKLIKQTTKLQKTFTPTQKAKYAHPSGGHDDWPDALMMANWARHGGGEQLETKQTNDVPLAW